MYRKSFCLQCSCIFIIFSDYKQYLFSKGSVSGIGLTGKENGEVIVSSIDQRTSTFLLHKGLPFLNDGFVRKQKPTPHNSELSNSWANGSESIKIGYFQESKINEEWVIQRWF